MVSGAETGNREIDGLSLRRCGVCVDLRPEDAINLDIRNTGPGITITDPLHRCSCECERCPGPRLERESCAPAAVE